MCGFMDGYRWQGDEDDFEVVHGGRERNEEGQQDNHRGEGGREDEESPGHDHEVDAVHSHHVEDAGHDDEEDAGADEGHDHEDEDAGADDDGPSMGWVQDPHIQELLLKQTDNARAAAREKAKLDQLELDAVTPLYEGCMPEDTRLKVTLVALEMKVKHKMTDACFDKNMSF